MSTRSSNPLTSLSTSMTTPPRRGPGGMWMVSLSAALVRSDSATSSSNRLSRALLLACRALGLERTHSSSRWISFCRLASLLPSIFIRVCLVSR